MRTHIEPGAIVAPWELRTVNIGHSYVTAGQRIAVLQGIDMVVGPENIVSILGASGSGKSTLLRILAGLERPDEGSVRLQADGQIPSLEKFSTLLAQDDVLLPFRTALQNILLPHEIDGRIDKDIKSSAISILERLKLSGIENAYPNELSGGMQKRCLVSLHLMLGRKLCFLDEPFASLDVGAVDILMELIAYFKRAFKTSFVIVLHDITIAAALSDEIIVLGGRPARIVAVHRPSPALAPLLPGERMPLPEFESLELSILRSLRSAGIHKSIVGESEAAIT